MILLFSHVFIWLYEKEKSAETFNWENTIAWTQKRGLMGIHVIMGCIDLQLDYGQLWPVLNLFPARWQILEGIVNEQKLRG